MRDPENLTRVKESEPPSSPTEKSGNERTRGVSKIDDAVHGAGAEHRRARTAQHFDLPACS